MDATTFVVEVFCLVDDWLHDRRLRRRGPNPILADSEVLTIECVGEFFGIDTDSGLYDHFRRWWGEWFPGLRRIHRTTFVRQAANLWRVKTELRRHLLAQVDCDPLLSVLDSTPIPICRFGRAYRCRRLREVAAFGRDETAKQTFLGLRAHLRICWPGVIVDGRLTPANIADQAVAPDLLRGAQGWALADSAYGGSALVAQLHVHGVELLAPPHGKPRTAAPLPRALTRKRRRVETVIGQLVDRYHLKRVWARDAWHLWSRWQRKLLSHTIAVLLCQRTGLPPLRFAQLVTD
ncbi:IS982 family transposase [Streptomyces niveiscabiei]|uniref:IS982 family transposase n=1 Tax=Streptomyces niveiscabiei TaxID=164115 RepID=A0ABW9I858_9ACTN